MRYAAIKFAIGVCACMAAMPALASPRYLYSVTNAPGMPLVRIDADSGVVTTLGPTNLPHPDFLFNTFDIPGQRLFLLTGTIGSQVLQIIDVTTVTVTSVPIPSSAAYDDFFEYDPATAALYSLLNAPGTPLVRIDPATGSIQTVAMTNLPIPDMGFSTFDPIGGRLFLLTGGAGAQVLDIINVRTGSVTTQPIPSSSPYLNFFEYDPQSGYLYSLTAAPGVPLVRIDPRTGVVQQLIDTNLPQLDAGFSTFDIVDGTLFLLGGTVGAQVLEEISVRTGAVTSVSVAIPYSYLSFFEFANQPQSIDVPFQSPVWLALLALALSVTAIVSLNRSA